MLHMSIVCFVVKGVTYSENADKSSKSNGCDNQEIDQEEGVKTK